MFHAGDIVRVRRYEEIPDHPIYRRNGDHIAQRKYFGLAETHIDEFSSRGALTVKRVEMSRYQTWYGATDESCRDLDCAREPVYMLEGLGNGAFDYRFLENMLEPYDDRDIETPDAEDFFASLF